MKLPLRLGAKGADVKALQTRLKQRGFDPGDIDGTFGNGTQSAVLAFQMSEGLLADGVVGERTWGMLDRGKPGALADATQAATVAVVSRMFPHTPLGNIKRNLPPVLDSLREARLHDRLMVLMALGTIRAETESFEPVAEGRSRYNTSPNGHPFDLYDNRKDLGNQGKPDGERFRGRGYVQLTGRDNYTRFSQVLGLGIELVTHPERASEPDIAGKLLAAFLGAHEIGIKAALLAGDFKEARRLVNGGYHGLDRFTEAYQIGAGLIS